jgi:succinylglutamate desuccinylase
LNQIQSDPNATKTLNKKEHGIRKQISELENNITLWRNNLEFFAASKTADKLKDQFDIKIQKAEDEAEKLKKKLAILKEF